VGTIVGGLTVAALIGVAVGLLLATTALAAVVLAFRARRCRRGCMPPARKLAP
jgi:CBS-domain-containing membrane protein